MNAGAINAHQDWRIPQVPPNGRKTSSVDYRAARSGPDDGTNRSSLDSPPAEVTLQAGAATILKPGITIDSLRKETVPRPEATAVQSEPEAITSADGVLRLIQEGHFKGVADVRLRINFFDALSASAQAAALPLLRDGARDLVQTVQEAVAGLLHETAVDEETEAALSEALETFSSSVQTVVDQAVEGGAIDEEAVSTAIRSAFDLLLAAIEPLLASAEVEISQAEEGEVSEESQVEVAPDPLSPLRGAFDIALADLYSSLTDAGVLSDPSPPAGQGRAYEKFLAVYNELRGVTPTIVEEA